MKYSFSLAALAAVASGHTIFLSLTSGGTEYPVGYGIRVPSYDGPITDVTTNYIACNGGPNPTTPSNKTINVVAGSTVQAKWRHTLDGPDTGTDYVVDPSHKGPVMAYLKKVTDATTDTGIGGGWFKISEAGLNVATQDWAVTDLIANNGYQNIQIPSCIANGQYLLRAELIALHGAGSVQGAQFYMECAQINVSGGTGTANPATVQFPNAYSQTDPGILINIYQTLTTYQIPGPTPYTCGANGGPTSTTRAAQTSTLVTRTTTPAVVTTTRTTTPAAVTTTTTRKTTTTTAGTGTGTGAPLYGQCGGQGWTGPTTCAQGTCTASGIWYSQCL